jgi:hypothetical protein
MPATQSFLFNPRNQGVLDGTEQYRPLRFVEDPGIGLLVAPLALIGSLAAIVLFLLPWGMSLWSAWWQLEYASIEGQATMVSRQEPTDETGYTVSYHFAHTPADGDPRRYTGTDTVNEQTYRRLEPGVVVPVWYVTDNPTISSLDRDERPSIFWTGVIALLVLMWCLGNISLFAEAASQWLKGRRLAQEGQIISGSVISCTGRMDDEGMFLWIRLHYRFRSPVTGQEIIDEHEKLRLELLNKEEPKKMPDLPPAGAPVAMLYLNDDTYDVL